MYAGRNVFMRVYVVLVCAYGITFIAFCCVTSKTSRVSVENRQLPESFSAEA